jgi:hypothetical protein
MDHAFHARGPFAVSVPETLAGAVFEHPQSPYPKNRSRRRVGSRLGLPPRMAHIQSLRPLITRPRGHLVCRSGRWPHARRHIRQAVACSNCRGGMEGR